MCIYENTHPHTHTHAQTPLFPKIDVVQMCVSAAEEGCGPTVAVEGDDDEEQEEKAAAAGQRSQNHRIAVQRQAGFSCGACRRCLTRSLAANITMKTIKTLISQTFSFTFLDFLTQARGGCCEQSFCGGGGSHGGLCCFF